MKENYDEQKKGLYSLRNVLDSADEKFNNTELEKKDCEEQPKTKLPEHKTGDKEETNFGNLSFEEKTELLSEMEEKLDEEEKNTYCKIVYLLQSSTSLEVPDKEEEIVKYLDEFPSLILILQLKFDTYLMERINAGDAKRVAVLRKYENFIKTDAE